jgi:hypothetical protein
MGCESRLYEHEEGVENIVLEDGGRSAARQMPPSKIFFDK